MSGTKVAVFTFFGLYGCPPCNRFKGNPPGTTTDLPPNPDGPWEKLTSDKELRDSGVEFVYFKFGTRRDPDGTTETFEVPPVYASRVTSAPYLELRLPNDLKNGERYNGPHEWTKVKEWILEKLKQEPYKSYRQSVQSNRETPYTSAAIRQDMMDNINGSVDSQSSSSSQPQQGYPVRTPQPHGNAVAQSAQRPRIQVQQPNNGYQPNNESRPQYGQSTAPNVNGMASNPRGVPAPIQTPQVQSANQQVNWSQQAQKFKPANYE